LAEIGIRLGLIWGCLIFGCLVLRHGGYMPGLLAEVIRLDTQPKVF